MSWLEDRITCARRLNARNVTCGAAAGAKGAGAFARRALLAGETAAHGVVERIEPRRTRRSIEIASGVRALLERPAPLLNHSGAPSLFVRQNTLDAFDFVALRDIAEGEELTFDYATTEDDIAAEFACRCGSALCRGRAGGFRRLPQDNPLLRARLVARHLLWARDHGPEARLPVAPEAPQPRSASA